MNWPTILGYKIRQTEWLLPKIMNLVNDLKTILSDTVWLVVF